MLRLARIKPAGMLQIKSAELKNSKAELIWKRNFLPMMSESIPAEKLPTE
jgi:hypothetical protein